MPCLALGKWILTTTKVSEFIAAMKKMHMPQTAIIPLSVVFRYFPTIREEWQSIRNAIKMRGVQVSFEHVIVPLLISAVNISEELSAAALCRGLDNPARHTSLCEIGFKLQDKIALSAIGGFVVIALLLKGGGII